MTKRVGVALEHLGASQMAFWLTSEANKVLVENHRCDIVVFYERSERECVLPHFARFPTSDLHNHPCDILIATSLSTARKVMRATAARQRYFYIWDIEWMRGPAQSFESLWSVYGESSLSIITRSQEHRRLFQRTWGRDSCVCPDFSLSIILSDNFHPGGLHGTEESPGGAILEE